MIEHVPPVGWADVATRHDVAGLEQRIDLRLARIEERFNVMDHRITAATSEFRAAFEHGLRSPITTVAWPALC